MNGKSLKQSEGKLKITPKPHDAEGWGKLIFIECFSLSLLGSLSLFLTCLTPPPPQVDLFRELGLLKMNNLSGKWTVISLDWAQPMCVLVTVKITSLPAR